MSIDVNHTIKYLATASKDIVWRDTITMAALIKKNKLRLDYSFRGLIHYDHGRTWLCSGRPATGEGADRSISSSTSSRSRCVNTVPRLGIGNLKDYPHSDISSNKAILLHNVRICHMATLYGTIFFQVTILTKRSLLKHISNLHAFSLFNIFILFM